MFELFDESARQLVVTAQMEARRARHPEIGTEHMLLAALEDGKSVSSRALASLGASQDVVRARVEARGERGAPEVEGQMPFTPEAVTALERGPAQSEAAGEGSVSAHHLVLGLLDADSGDGALAVLGDLGLSAEQVRDAIRAQLRGTG